jgi:hypothetical protein
LASNSPGESGLMENSCTASERTSSSWYNPRDHHAHTVVGERVAEHAACLVAGVLGEIVVIAFECSELYKPGRASGRAEVRLIAPPMLPSRFAALADLYYVGSFSSTSFHTTPPPLLLLLILNLPNLYTHHPLYLSLSLIFISLSSLFIPYLPIIDPLLLPPNSIPSSHYNFLIPPFLQLFSKLPSQPPSLLLSLSHIQSSSINSFSSIPFPHSLLPLH